MSYYDFLFVTAQLAAKKVARISIGEELIFFESLEKKNHYTLYAKVFYEDGYIPQSVRSCVSSSGILRWQAQGAYLKLDPLTNAVYLFQNVAMEKGKYLPFKHYVNDFIAVAKEWKEILQELAENNCLLKRVGLF